MTNVDTVPNQPAPPIMALRQWIEVRKAEIKAALPPDITYEQFLRAVMTAVSLNPDILLCSKSSLWFSLLRACRDGLLPDGVEGAIVPYKATASWIPMYQGLLRRFRRSGQFKWIKADLVRQGDEFSHYTTQDGEFLHHVPCDDFTAPITRIYACATTKDGGSFVAVMSITEANKIKAMSKASRDDAPWKLHEGEMYKKTALRRLSKVLPSARDIMPDEDLPAEAAPALVPIGETAPPITEMRQISEPTPRAGSAAAALEQFAAEQPHAAGAPDVAVAEGGADAKDRATDSSVDPIRVAYERGVDWRTKGNARKGIPMEYRDNNRQREALAWQAGFDDKSMPTWTKDA